MDAKAIFEKARKVKAKVAIGAPNDLKVANSVCKSAKRAVELGYANVLVITEFEEIKDDVEVEITTRPEKRLTELLNNGEVDAVVRGALSSDKFIDEVKRVFKLSVLERASLIESPSGELFFLGPTGIDEGLTLNQKIGFIIDGASMASRLDMVFRVGVLSGGRLNDLGRNPEVDRSLVEGEFIASRARDMGFQVKHYQILLEDALREKATFILAPNGVVGNLIFRTLVLVAGWNSLGAPVLNVGKIIIDTSRARGDYLRPIVLASALSGT